MSFSALVFATSCLYFAAGFHVSRKLPKEVFDAWDLDGVAEFHRLNREVGAPMPSRKSRMGIMVFYVVICWIFEPWRR